MTDPICELGVFTTEERQYHLAHSVRLFTEEQDTLTETEDGCELTFRPKVGRIVELAEWMGFESRCCPWIRYSLIVTGIDIRLRMEAPGRKALIAEGLDGIRRMSTSQALPSELRYRDTLLPGDFERITKAV